jgi:hypothetical protein
METVCRVLTTTNVPYRHTTVPQALQLVQTRLVRLRALAMLGMLEPGLLAPMSTNVWCQTTAHLVGFQFALIPPALTRAHVKPDTLEVATRAQISTSVLYRRTTVPQASQHAVTWLVLSRVLAMLDTPEVG